MPLNLIVRLPVPPEPTDLPGLPGVHIFSALTGYVTTVERTATPPRPARPVSVVWAARPVFASIRLPWCASLCLSWRQHILFQAL